MKTKKEKKLAHIQVKDNGLIVSSKIGGMLADVKAALETELLNGLIKGSNEKSLLRYKIKQNIALQAFKLNVDKLTKQTSKAVETALKADKTVNLTPNQVASMSSTMNKGLLFLQNNAVQTYQSSLNSLYLKIKSASELQDELQKHIDSGLDIGVIYKDGKHYRFDTYYEMKFRTDIQQDIGSNLIEAGHAAGAIFYICSFFGDCAKDHADWQGRIYYDSDWKAIAPKDRVDEIQSYIDSQKLKSVQEIMDAPVYLTTRPNCRHHFLAIDIDSVLGAKTNADVNKLREERNLNTGGQYQPDKYKALQEQRLNERKIRAEKKIIDKLEHELALKPADKNLQMQILNREDKVRQYQADQRTLIKQYDNLIRSYERESIRSRVKVTK